MDSDLAFEASCKAKHDYRIKIWGCRPLHIGKDARRHLNQHVAAAIAQVSGWHRAIKRCDPVVAAGVKNVMLYAQDGEDIVHDFSPEGEWQETQNKLLAVLRAAEMVQQGWTSRTNMT